MAPGQSMLRGAGPPAEAAVAWPRRGHRGTSGEFIRGGEGSGGQAALLVSSRDALFGEYTFFRLAQRGTQGRPSTLGSRTILTHSLRGFRFKAKGERGVIFLRLPSWQNVWVPSKSGMPNSALARRQKLWFGAECFRSCWKAGFPDLVLLFSFSFSSSCSSSLRLPSSEWPCAVLIPEGLPKGSTHCSGVACWLRR